VSSRESIAVSLSSLRRAARSSVALRGLCILAMACVAVAVASLLIDRTFRLPRAARIVLLAASAAALAWVAWSRILRPLFRRIPDTAAAGILEKRFPELGDRLRSAVDFGKTEETDEADISAVMRRRVLREAASLTASLDPTRAVDTPGVAATLVLACAILAAAGIGAALALETAETWFRRNVLLEAIEWPYRTRLAVEGFSGDEPALGVPRGDRLAIAVTASGEIPERVQIRLVYPTESFRSTLVREGDARFVHEHGEVTEGFRFRVEGGDFRSREHRVIVKERPEVASFAVHLEYPAYTGKSAETLEKDLGDIAFPEGTRLSIEARATKPLRAAWLDTPDGKVELEVSSAEPDRIRGLFAPREGGTVTVHLEDREGVPPDRWLRFLVTPEPDRIPTVASSTKGIGTMITPLARIPLEIRATDDHGVTALGAAYEVAGEDVEKRSGATAFAPPAAPGPAVEEEAAFEVEPVQVEPGKRLDLRATASDNDAIHGPKTGHGPLQSFLVVTAERLLEEFLRREEEQRRLLEKITGDERGIRDATYRLIDESWKNDGALPDPATKEMVGMSRAQRQMARQLGGMAGAVRQILDEMRNNRIAELTETERLTSAIIDPLIDLSERLLPQAGKSLDTIREMPRAEERLRAGLELAGLIDEILDRMDKVIASMHRLEGFTEIVNRLRSIIQVHDEASDSVKKAYQRELDRIFESDSDGSSGGAGR